MSVCVYVCMSKCIASVSRFQTSGHDLQREAGALKHLEELGDILRLHP